MKMLTCYFIKTLYPVCGRKPAMNKLTIYPRLPLLMLGILLTLLSLTPALLLAQDIMTTTGKPFIMQIIERGNAAAVKDILDRDASQASVVDVAGRTPLHLAAVNGSTDIISVLLAVKGININAKDRDGDTPLHLAALQGSVDSVQALLAKGALPELRNAFGASSLHLAAKPEVVALFLKDKTTADKQKLLASRDNQGRTPLHWGAGLGNLPVVNSLLDQGAEVQSVDDVGMTPCFFSVMSDTAAVNMLFELVPLKGYLRSALQKAAAQADKLNAVSALLARGALLKTQDAFGRTPLHVAVASGDKMVKLLLEKGADATVKDNAGDLPICYAARSSKSVLQMFKDQGQDLHVVNQHGYTLLHQAAAEGNSDTVTLLLAEKLEVNALSQDGETPLHLAAATGTLEVVKLLIDAKADFMRKTNNGKTVQKIAMDAHQDDIAQYLGTLTNMTPEQITWSELDAVKAMLNNGMAVNADINGSNGLKSTPLHLAARGGNVEVVKYLLEQGANLQGLDNNKATPLITAAESGKVEIVKLLLEKGADPNAKNVVGRTGLHVTNNVEVARLLVQAGAKVTETEMGGDTPLFKAIFFGNNDLVKFYLDNGAKITDLGNSKRGVLSLAVMFNRGQQTLDLLQYLLDKGADINQQDILQMTPLAYAVQRGSVEVVKILLTAHGVDLSLKNNAGDTVLQTAQKMNNAAMPPIVKLLQDAGAK